MAITVDVGAEATDRAWHFHQGVLDFVLIEGSNPASEDGKVTKVACFIEANQGLVSIGTFYKTNGDQFSCRAFQADLATLVGYNEFEVDLDVAVGDFIGILLPADRSLELDTTGGVGIWYVQTSDITLDHADCTYTASYIASLGGEITPTLPEVTTDAASGVAVASATLNGTLDNQGIAACDCGFEWGPDTGYGITTSPQAKTTGETFSHLIGGLPPGTTYHFRAFATNPAGTSYGADRSFTTALVITRAYALARQEL